MSISKNFNMGQTFPKFEFECKNSNIIFAFAIFKLTSMRGFK